MKKSTLLLCLAVGLLVLLPVLSCADIAATKTGLALFLKPSWAEGGYTSGHWDWDDTHEWYVSGSRPTGHGGRQFYQYEDSAGDGILYVVAPSAKGLPKGYKHKGCVVVSELGWKEQTPVTAAEVWEIWQGIADDYFYKKQGVTQIQLLSDELHGKCAVLDNKYGTRDLRILVYGAELTGDAEKDKALIEEKLITAIDRKGLCTK